MKEIKTKEDVFKAICNASRLGNLGFFVGSGFTKAILENNTYYEAYTWAELLKVCCEEMKINENILKNKNSYPEIATKICKEYSIENNITYQEAVRKMKCIISEKTNVYPEESIKEDYEKYFRNIPASWITTTNYDTVLENIFGR